MACIYKALNEGCTRPYCKVTDGECQFVLNDKDSICSIRDAYKGGEVQNSIMQIDINTKMNAKENVEKNGLFSKLRSLFSRG